jgi:RNA polymerase sigma-70 factor (ECF subfamily)
MELLMSMADGDPLIQCLTEGRSEAFSALYDRFGGSLFQVALAMLGSRPDAEDAVQDVFVSLVRARQRLAGVENLRAYLFATLRHAALKVSAGRKWPSAPASHSRGQWDVPDLSLVPAPESGSVALDRSVQLEQALRRLPAEQRELVALKIDGGLTFAEIASLLGISPNTAAGRYRYALEKLRDALKE